MRTFINPVETLSFRMALVELLIHWTYIQENPLFEEDEEGSYIRCGKFTIRPTEATYKDKIWSVEEGVFERLSCFLKFLIPKFEEITNKSENF